jgi:hypothetical protein
LLSWPVFSLGTNFPSWAVLEALLEVVVAAALLAAFPDPALNREPPRAPPAREPASTNVRIDFLPIVMNHLRSFAVEAASSQTLGEA